MTGNQHITPLEARNQAARSKNYLGGQAASVAKIFAEADAASTESKTSLKLSLLRSGSVYGVCFRTVGTLIPNLGYEALLPALNVTGPRLKM